MLGALEKLCICNKYVWHLLEPLYLTTIFARSLLGNL